MTKKWLLLLSWTEEWSVYIHSHTHTHTHLTDIRERHLFWIPWTMITRSVSHWSLLTRCVSHWWLLTMMSKKKHEEKEDKRENHDRNVVVFPRKSKQGVSLFVVSSCKLDPHDLHQHVASIHGFFPLLFPFYYQAFLLYFLLVRHRTMMLVYHHWAQTGADSLNATIISHVILPYKINTTWDETCFFFIPSSWCLFF